MKHGIKGRKLNRTSPHRQALLQNLASALIKHQRIRTTLPKAKELRPYIEKIITSAKEKTVYNQRVVAKSIKDKSILKSLFDDIAPVFKNRNGGYTRILKHGFRTGDKAPMAIIEFVDKANLEKVEVLNDKKGKKSVKKSDKKTAPAEENSEKKEAAKS